MLLCFIPFWLTIGFIKTFRWYSYYSMIFFFFFFFFFLMQVFFFFFITVLTSLFRNEISFSLYWAVSLLRNIGNQVGINVFCVTWIFANNFLMENAQFIWFLFFFFFFYRLIYFSSKWYFSWKPFLIILFFSV